MNETIFIGKGGYGTVYRRGRYAIKNFPDDHRSNSMIREIVISNFFITCPNVLFIEKVNLNQNKHYTPFYEKNLKMYIRENTEMSVEDKVTKLKSLLYGLACMHGKGITHADIKPSNILYNGEYFIIGDLGLSSLSGYSKCSRTAKFYREPIINRGPTHDMYSLGIILIEFLCNKRIRKVYAYEDLCDFARQLEDKYYRIIISLINPDKEKRYNIFDLYFVLYNEDISSLKNEYYCEDKNEIDEDSKKLLVRYEIMNKMACYMLYINNRIDNEYKNNIVFYCCMYIASCLFGGNMTINKIKNKLKTNVHYINNVLIELLNNQNNSIILFTNY